MFLKIGVIKLLIFHLFLDVLNVMARWRINLSDWKNKIQKNIDWRKNIHCKFLWKEHNLYHKFLEARVWFSLNDSWVFQMKITMQNTS